MSNYYNGLEVIFDERDDTGRSIRSLYSDGWGCERIFDDDWDKEIPAEVIETQDGKVVYERHYNNVVVDSRKGIGV